MIFGTGTTVNTTESGTRVYIFIEELINLEVSVCFDNIDFVQQLIEKSTYTLREVQNARS